MPFRFIIQQWQDTIYSSCYASEGISFFFFLIAFNEPHGPSAASYSNKQMQIYCAQEFY